MPKTKSQEEKDSTKKVPVAIRLPQEIVSLGRSIARTEFGGEDKLGQFIEEAIKFYSANSENETRASALLEVTEERLIRRISDKFESMYQDLVKRENKMVDRIAGLQAVSSFETTLTELMLKDTLIKTEQQKTRYEELRGKASSKMKDRLTKAGAEQIAELQEQNLNLEAKIRKQDDEYSSIVSKYNDLVKKFNDKLATIKTLSERNDSKDLEIEKLKVKIHKYNALIQWYEKRDRQIPRIQDENKGTFRKMSYEQALAVFENENPKPII